MRSPRCLRRGSPAASRAGAGDDFAIACVCVAYSYNLALASVKVARAKLDTLGEAHRRPDDYFAEMLKTDTHMQRVRTTQQFPCPGGCARSLSVHAVPVMRNDARHR